MKRLLFILLMLVVAFCFATNLQSWHSGLDERGARAKDPLSLLLGDARRMFAKHFFIKADAYFHSGFYPSIYDNREAFRTPHMAADAGALEENNKGDEENFLGKPRDWIESFGREFFPSAHTHLGQDSPEAKKEVELGHSSEVREILPWLKVSASLDPQRVETYSVTAYWLRSQMGKVREAESFLRDGLRENPGSPILLFELGNIFAEEHKDAARARNVWEFALRNLGDLQDVEGERRFIIGQILGRLAKLEEDAHRYTDALKYLRLLEDVSPAREAIQRWRTDVEKKMNDANNPVKQ
jgi:hypothetical protein